MYDHFKEIDERDDLDPLDKNLLKCVANPTMTKQNCGYVNLIFKQIVFERQRDSKKIGEIFEQIKKDIPVLNDFLYKYNFEGILSVSLIGEYPTYDNNDFIPCFKTSDDPIIFLEPNDKSNKKDFLECKEIINRITQNVADLIKKWGFKIEVDCRFSIESGIVIQGDSRSKRLYI